MTRRVLAISLVLALLGLALGFVFAPAPARSPAPISAAEYGTRSARNIIAIEPYVRPADYRSASDLRERLAAYLEEAKARGFLTERSVVLFPEHTGSWLVAARAPGIAHRTRDMRVSSLSIALSAPFSFTRAYGASDEPDRFAAALFRMRSAQMAADYQSVFSALAADYGATIVAGSTVLENPAIENGKIVAREGPLYNVSVVFAPTGDILAPLIVKRELIPSERAFAEGGSTEVPIFETPAGRLGVLICADSWHKEVYAPFVASGVDLLAVPAFLDADDVWEAPWRGYVTPWPDDAARSDAGALTEGEAWVKYSAPARIAATGAKAGATAFLRGRLWSLGADGRLLVMRSGETELGPALAETGAVSAIWF